MRRQKRRADVAIWDVSGLEAAGAWDPVAALLLSGPPRVRDLFVEGRRVVGEGRMVTVDEAALAAEQTTRLHRLVDGG